MQYQQAMEYMKRRMDIFEMTLVSKQTHAEPTEVSGYALTNQIALLAELSLVSL